MRLCRLFSKRTTPFLLIPLLSIPVAAATWFVTTAAGIPPLQVNLASAAALIVFAGALTLYILHCLSRYPCR